MLRLYPSVTVVGQDFSKAKIYTKPMQALTLRQIIERFTRGEKLPIEKDGIYAENFGDLEKMVRADLYDQNEHSTRMWDALAKADKTIKDRQKAVDNPTPPPAPLGAVTGSGGLGQVPPPSPPAAPAA